MAKYNVMLILGFDFDENSYEFGPKIETVNMTICDFLVPLFRIKGRGLNFDQFKFFCEGAPSQYKKFNQTPKGQGGIYCAVV